MVYFGNSLSGSAEVDTHLKNLLEHWSNNKDFFIIYHNSNNKGAWRLKQLKNKVKVYTFMNLILCLVIEKIILTFY